MGSLLRVVLLLGASILAAQGPGRLPVRTYESAQGLGALFAHGLVQDRQGFIYAAGGEGLFRGDGRTFYPLPLPGRSVNPRCLLADAEGAIWAATPAGLFVLHPGQSDVQPVKAGLPASPITGLGRDAQGRHWVLAEGRPYREEAPRTFAPVPGWPLQHRAVGLVLRPESPRCLVVTTTGLLEWDAKGGWRTCPVPPLLARDGFQEGLVDGQGQLWLRSRLGLWRQPQPGSTWIALTDRTGGRPAVSMTPDGKDGVWLTGRFGVALARGAAWEPLPLSDQVPASQARTTLVDWDGNLWVSASGLHLVLGRGNWRTYTPAHGLPALDAWALLLDRRSRLWLGTGDGLAIPEGDGWRTVLRGEGIFALGEAPDGAIWASGNDNGTLLRIDPVTLRSRRITVLEGAEGRFARGFAFRGPEVWVASLTHGVWVGRPSGGTLAWRPLDEPILEGRVPRHLLQDRRGRIYLPLRDELLVLDGQTWHRIPNRLQDPAYVCTLDPKGDLWIGSFESIVLERHRFTPAGIVHAESLTLPEQHQGMHVYSVAFDARGRMWVGTSHGILRLEAGQPPLRFTTAEGLPSNDSNRPGILATEDGDVWVPTSFGLGRYSGQGETDTPPLREPRLSRIQFTDRSLPLPPARLRFEPRDRAMTWHFCVPSYGSLPRLRYEVQLDDGTEWLDIPQGSMGFSHLPPGPHELRVRARLPEGQTSPVARLSFVLLPRWWEPRWVRVLGILAAAGLAALGAAGHVRRVKRRNALLERIVSERTADLVAANADVGRARDLLERAARGKAAHLASLNHELRNPLNAILLYTEMLMDPHAELGEEARQEAYAGIRAAGQKAQALVGSVLDLAKLEAGIMPFRPQPLRISALLRGLGDHLPPDLDLVLPEQGLGEEIVGDLELLHRVLSLLAVFERTGSPRAVRLDLERRPDAFRISLALPPPGLSPSQIELLFLDFTQDWSQRSIPWHPMALELTVCRLCLERMGGRLEVAGDSAEGIRFDLFLPA